MHRKDAVVYGEVMMAGGRLLMLLNRRQFVAALLCAGC